MVNSQAIGGLFKVLDLLFEVLVTASVNLVELILIDEVFGHLLQIVVSRPVKLGGVCEEKGTLLEREGADLCDPVCSLDGLDGLIKESIDDLFGLEPGLLNRGILTY